ncbi:MAG: hypothetical protein EOP56_18050 [Sphingobacteriales bacterium]|nr:MAG: hypothetical protein EOP56_18050 [Sphingobacteriales bacterium]
MRSNTLLKKLLEHNTVALVMDRGKYDLIVTNRDTGNAHVVTAWTLSQAYTKAYKDTRRISKDLNF